MIDLDAELQLSIPRAVKDPFIKVLKTAKLETAIGVLREALRFTVQGNFHEAVGQVAAAIAVAGAAYKKNPVLATKIVSAGMVILNKIVDRQNLSNGQNAPLGLGLGSSPGYEDFKGLGIPEDFKHFLKILKETRSRLEFERRTRSPYALEMLSRQAMERALNLPAALPYQFRDLTDDERRTVVTQANRLAREAADIHADAWSKMEPWKKVLSHQIRADDLVGEGDLKSALIRLKEAHALAPEERKWWNVLDIFGPPGVSKKDLQKSIEAIKEMMTTNS